MPWAFVTARKADLESIFLPVAGWTRSGIWSEITPRTKPGPRGAARCFSTSWPLRITYVVMPVPSSCPLPCAHYFRSGADADVPVGSVLVHAAHLHGASLRA